MGKWCIACVSTGVSTDKQKPEADASPILSAHCFLTLDQVSH